MKIQYRILLSILAIIVFLQLLNSPFNGIQIYVFGVIYNIIYTILYNIFKTEEYKDKEQFLHQFISKETHQLINILLWFLSWSTPFINIISSFNELKNNADNR